MFIHFHNLHYEQFPNGTIKCIEDEIPFDIPEGWSWCRLSMVGTTNIGLTYKPTEVKETGTIVLRSCNIKNGKMDFADLVRVQADIRENQYIYEKDILICARNGSRSLVGKCAIMQGLTEVASFGAFMAVFRSICNQYVYYYFNTSLFRRSFDNDDSKQINQVTQAILRDTLIPLPPFAEQTRIVTKLHETLSLVDFINDGTEQIETIITNTKAKILDLAIRGKLVPQNPDDEPASVLLERIRAEKEELIKQGKIKRDKKESVIFKGDDNSYYENLPKNWSICTLGDISEIITGGTPSKSNKDYYNGSFPFFKPADLEQGVNTIIPSEYLSDEGKNVSRVIPAQSTLICCIGTIGKNGFVRCECATNQQINAVIPHIEPKYIYYFCNSQFFINDLQRNATATTVAIINKSKTAETPFLLPPIAEQKRIVEAIEIAFAQLDEILNSIL